MVAGRFLGHVLRNRRQTKTGRVVWYLFRPIDLYGFISNLMLCSAPASVYSVTDHEKSFCWHSDRSHRNGLRSSLTQSDAAF